MSKSDLGAKVVYTVPEAGELLGLSRAAAYEAARRGEIPVVRIGKLVKVPKAALERFLASAEQPSAPSPKGSTR